MALKVLGVASVPVRSRAMFSSMWGFMVFSVLRLCRSRALFSDTPWPPVVFLEVVFFRFGALVFYFPVCGALPFQFLASLWVAFWLAGSGRALEVLSGTSAPALL